MAVTFVAANSLSGTNVSSLTFAVDVGAGSDRCIVIESACWDAADDGLPSAATFNGAASTQHGTAEFDGGNRVTLRYKVNPDSGSHDVEVTYPGSVSECSAGAKAFDGALQSGTPLGPFNSANNTSGATLSVGIETSSTNEIVTDCFYANVSDATGPVAGAGQTERWDETIVTNSETGGSTEAGTGGTVTMSWTKDSTGGWIICGAAVRDTAWAPTEDTTRRHFPWFFGP